MLHGLLLALHIGIQGVYHVLRSALGRLDDGKAIALHHHCGKGGGKILRHAILQVEHGHHHVGDLIIELVGLIVLAVAVLSGVFPVRAFGEDHIILVVLGAAGIVEDLGVVFGGTCSGGSGLARAAGCAAAYQSQQGSACQQRRKDAFQFHSGYSFRS